MSRHRDWLLAALLALTVLVYLPGLPGPAMLDDQHNLGPLADVQAGRTSGWHYVFAPGDGAVSRPVARLSFLVTWYLAGDDLRAFKAVNLAVHLLCGLAVFAFVREVALLDPHLARQGHSLALLVCAAWLLSPMLVSTVLYTVQRMAQLAALFTLLGLWAYTAGRARGRRALVALALAVCWPLATASKENGAVLPVLALLVELWFLAGRPGHVPYRRVLLACCAVPAVALLARIAVDPDWLLAGYRERDFTLAERLLTQPRVLFDYLANLLLVPGASPLGLLRDDVHASTGVLQPATTATALAGGAAVLALALASRRSRLAGAGFGLLFFLAAHLPEASVFPLELYFEHRNYLPAVGVLFAAAAGLAWLTREHPRAFAGIAVGVLVALAALTAQRAWIWRSEAAIYEHAVYRHPRSARAWLGLASVAFQAGRADDGRAALERARALLGADSGFALAVQELAAACVAGRPVDEDTWQRLARAPRIGADLHTANALAWLAGALAAGSCRALDRARLARHVAGLEVAPGSGRSGRARDTHLARLRDVLAIPAHR